MNYVKTVSEIRKKMLDRRRRFQSPRHYLDDDEVKEEEEERVKLPRRELKFNSWLDEPMDEFRWVSDDQMHDWKLMPHEREYEMWIERSPSLETNYWEYEKQELTTRVDPHLLLFDFYKMCVLLANQRFVGDIENWNDVRSRDEQFFKRMWKDFTLDIPKPERSMFKQHLLEGTNGKIYDIPLTCFSHFSNIRVLVLMNNTILRFKTRHCMFDLLWALWKINSPCLNTLRKVDPAKNGLRYEKGIVVEFNGSSFVRLKNGESDGEMRVDSDDWQ